MRRQRRINHDANVSFLDVICCGFGAIILLLVIVKPNLPIVLEQSEINRQGQVRQMQERLFDIRGQVEFLETELNAKHQQLSEQQSLVAILRGEFDRLNSRLASLEDAGVGSADEALDLRIALQKLSREMKQLLAGKASKNNYIAGIPVDSEYIIFVIDTSGSMFNYAWNRLMREVISTLDLYPKVKGLQIMNDQGQYMFASYRGEWIPDTPARRRAIVKKLANWNAFSNSSPVQGINTAIQRFYAADKKISLYVFGDDFSGGSIRRVLDVVKSLNSETDQSESLVRIHAVGFPVHYQRAVSPNSSAAKYAALMRELAQQNHGTFIGLNDIR